MNFKHIVSTVALALLMAASTGSTADSFTAVSGGSTYAYTYSDVSGSADAITFVDAPNFNGSWLLVNGFGGSADSSNTYDSVVKQKSLYGLAKSNGDIRGQLETAFWPWVQGWALFNEGKRLSKQGRYSQAIPYLKQAIRVVLGAEPPADGVPAERILEADRQSEWVVQAASSYLLFSERNLGLKPWPKATK